MWGQLNFRRGIPKKFQEQISPILATKAKAIVGGYMMGGGDGDDNGSNIIAYDRHFYIGYRRRGADETNKPAVADLLFMYCRVHKATVMESNFDKSLKKSSTRNTGGSVGDSANVNLMTTTDNLNESNENQGTDTPHLAAAVLRRGLSTGASLAKRVAASGKNRIMRIRSTMGNVKEEDDDHDEEESNIDEEEEEEVKVQEERNNDNIHEIIRNNCS